MSVVSCNYKRDCAGSDFPITNYSAEGAEQFGLCFSLYFPQSAFDGGCISVCTVSSTGSTCDSESQNAADLCALQQAGECPPGDVRHIFCNTANTCSCVSVDGSEFFYTTPAGTFCADTQEAADALAHAYACEHCSNPFTSTRLGDITANACLGSAYSSTIIASGVAPLAWVVSSGSLPLGLSLNSHTGLISGTCISSGSFAFTIEAFDASGNFARRTYTICVVSIQPAVLSDGEVGTAYSQTFLTDACTPSPRVWSVASGSLPDGLTLDPATGILSGTPTVSASYNFTIRLTSGT